MLFFCIPEKYPICVHLTCLTLITINEFGVHARTNVMLTECVRVGSATTQWAAEVLSGVPLGAIITAALKGQECVQPCPLYFTNQIHHGWKGLKFNVTGAFVAVVYRRHTSSTKLPNCASHAGPLQTTSWRKKGFARLNQVQGAQRRAI